MSKGKSQGTVEAPHRTCHQLARAAHAVCTEQVDRALGRPWAAAVRAGRGCRGAAGRSAQRGAQHVRPLHRAHEHVGSQNAPASMLVSLNYPAGAPKSVTTAGIALQPWQIAAGPSGRYSVRRACRAHDSRTAAHVSVRRPSCTAFGSLDDRAAASSARHRPEVSLGRRTSVCGAAGRPHLPPSPRWVPVAACMLSGSAGAVIKEPLWKEHVSL